MFRVRQASERDILGVKGSEGAVRHAVDGPLRVTVLVADGDGEAAVVSP